MTARVVSQIYNRHSAIAAEKRDRRNCRFSYGEHGHHMMIVDDSDDLLYMRRDICMQGPTQKGGCLIFCRGKQSLPQAMSPCSEGPLRPQNTMAQANGNLGHQSRKSKMKLLRVNCHSSLELASLIAVRKKQGDFYVLFIFNKSIRGSQFHLAFVRRSQTTLQQEADTFFCARYRHYLTVHLRLVSE